MYHTFIVLNRNAIDEAPDRDRRRPGWLADCLRQRPANRAVQLAPCSCSIDERPRAARRPTREQHDGRGALHVVACSSGQPRPRQCAAGSCGLLLIVGGLLVETVELLSWVWDGSSGDKQLSCCYNSSHAPSAVCQWQRRQARRGAAHRPAAVRRRPRAGARIS